MERWEDVTIAYKKLERISSSVEVQSNIQEKFNGVLQARGLS